MQKLLIVEDEWIIRKSLEKIDWQSIGVDEIISAENGRDGIEKARVKRPQVILADINMPFVDGIEMAQEILTFLNAQVIFLTGYNEFDYAKAALKMRAFDYILKPVQKEVLLPQVKAAFEWVEEENTARAVEKEFAAKKFMQMALFEEQADVSMFEKLSLPASFFIYFTDTKELGLPNEATMRLKEDHYFGFLTETDYQQIDQTQLDGLLKEKKRVGLLKAYEYGEDKFIENLYDQYLAFLRLRFFEAGFFEDIPEKCQTQPKELLDYEEKVIAAIRKKDISNVQSLVQELRQHLLQSSTSFTALKMLAEKLFFVINAQILPDKEIELQRYFELEQCQEIEDLLAYIFDLIEQWIKQEEKDREEQTLIGQAIQYIDEHFSDESISLQQVAEHIHVSYPYLSNLFKTEVNKNYTEYLLECRIQAAQELLLSTNDSITEIALSTGFSNSNYFSSCFKKFCGKSPKQYRETR